MKQIFVVYETDAWHSTSHRECAGVFTSKWVAVNAIVKNHRIELDEFFSEEEIEKTSKRVLEAEVRRRLRKELEFMYSSRVLTCKDIITAISPFGSVIRRAKQPFNLVLCQIPFIDIPYLNVIVGFIALRLVGKLQFFAESASYFGFQHSF